MQKSILAADPYRIIKPDTTQLSRSPSDDRETQGVTESVKTRRGIPAMGMGSVRKMEPGQAKSLRGERKYGKVAKLAPARNLRESGSRTQGKASR